jgi:hypothetical protein
MKNIPVSLILASLLPGWLVLGCPGGDDTPAKTTAVAVPDIYAADRWVAAIAQVRINAASMCSHTK